MGMLRSLLVFFWMAVTVIPFALAIILMAPFVGPDVRWWYLARPWLSGAVEAVRLVGGIQYSVEGEQGLPTAEDNQRIIQACQVEEVEQRRNAAVKEAEDERTAWERADAVAYELVLEEEKQKERDAAKKGASSK